MSEFQQTYISVHLSWQTAIGRVSVIILTELWRNRGRYTTQTTKYENAQKLGIKCSLPTEASGWAPVQNSISTQPELANKLNTFPHIIRSYCCCFFFVCFLRNAGRWNLKRHCVFTHESAHMCCTCSEAFPQLKAVLNKDHVPVSHYNPIKTF